MFALINSSQGAFRLSENFSKDSYPNYNHGNANLLRESISADLALQEANNGFFRTNTTKSERNDAPIDTLKHNGWVKKLNVKTGSWNKRYMVLE